MEVQKFIHPQFGEIRTMTMADGQVGFVGKDVAEVLGYSNTRDAIRKHVDDEDKTTVAICDTGSNYKTQATIINESGLYSLILLSYRTYTYGENNKRTREALVWTQKGREFIIKVVQRGMAPTQALTEEPTGLQLQISFETGL